MDSVVPAMGYNSWYDLMGSLNETNLIETVDKMIELGLLEASVRAIVDVATSCNKIRSSAFVMTTRVVIA